jgi:site-specific DNA recombinase
VSRNDHGCLTSGEGPRYLRKQSTDEGIDPSAIPGLNEGGSPFRRATPTLTRRVKQAIAEWHVLNVLELSWGGLKAHTGQGHNIGKPPYGYLPEKLRHHRSRRRPRGQDQAPAGTRPAPRAYLTQIFLWRA